MARKPTLGTRYSRLKTIVIQELKGRESYVPSDEILIDELLFSIKIADDAKSDIKKRGLQINVVKDPKKTPYYQQNPNIGVYLSASKSIGNILTKLGITVQERTKLKLNPEEDDPLGDLFNQKSKVVQA
jgi:P27 family predicted phage terminase small subunit